LHYWSFQTELAPALIDLAPKAGQTGISPLTDLSLTFSRAMDVHVLAAEVKLVETESALPIALSFRQDPGDERHIAVVPLGLLDPNATYALTVDRQARDVDGNQLVISTTASFVTGPAQPLNQALSFSAIETGNSSQGGVWIFDPTGASRLAAPVGAVAFSWSSDGLGLICQNSAGQWFSWSLTQPGVTALPFQADWAEPLTSIDDVVYRQGSSLYRWRMGVAQPQLLATDVKEAAVAPNGSEIAYVVPASSSSGDEIWAVFVDTLTRNRLGKEGTMIDSLAWAPDGSGLAYEAGDSGHKQLRVRDLTQAGNVRTLISGDLGPARWQTGSSEMLVSAHVPTATQAQVKLFTVTLSDSPETLDPGAGLPARNDLSPELSAPSPDGRQIAFVSSDGTTSQIWMMNSDGTGLTPLTAWDPTTFPDTVQFLTWTR
jgi:hypothetical protein